MGRTLALVNSAFSLAARGKNVILIDFDLEAPGLDAFPLLKPPDPIPGLLEYVEEYLRAGTSPDLRRFIRTIHEAPGEGSIHIMYAGCFDKTYPERLGRINWSDFYTTHNGYYFFENLKDDLRQEYSPDYVLIDSRTGQADVTGVATIHLPDVVVVMYALDEQNLRGAARMAEAIRDNPIRKPIKVIPVASRVPTAADYSNLLKDRIKEAERRGIQPSVVLPAEPSLAFGEAVLAHPRANKQVQSLSPLRGKIEELVADIIRSNAEDPDNLLEEARRAFAHGDRERVWELFSMIARSLASPRTLLEFAALMMSTGRYSEAVQALNIAREMAPGWPDPLIKLALVAISSATRNLPEAGLYAQQYLQKGGQAADEVYSVAYGLLRAGDPIAAEPLLRWCMTSDNTSIAGGARGDLVRELVAQNRLSEALELFKQAFSSDPRLAQNPVWLYNYAEALRRSGRPDNVEAFRRFLGIAGPLEQALVNTMSTSKSYVMAFGGGLMFEDSLANFAQGFGHALAVLDEKTRARTYLEWAIELAHRVAETRSIFSTVSYRYEAPSTFIQHTRVLLKDDVGIDDQTQGGLFAKNQ